MLRRYTREGYLDCVSRLRAAIPGLALTTDVIVGFPGETEDDFSDTLAVVRDVGFDDAYTFKFSPREGTPATRFPLEDTVPDEAASDRLARLIDAVRSGTRARHLSLLGTQHEVLAERVARRGGALMARTRDFKTVLVPGRCFDARALLLGTPHGDDGFDIYRRPRPRATRAARGRAGRVASSGKHSRGGRPRRIRVAAGIQSAILRVRATAERM